jgi:hypothetical protein
MMILHNWVVDPTVAQQEIIPIALAPGIRALRPAADD